MQKITQYLLDVKSELGRVSWPTKEEVLGATKVVIAFTAIISVVVKVFDLGLNWVIGQILSL